MTKTLETQQERVEAQSNGQSLNPMDIDPKQFKAGLDRRKKNREALMEWVRSALVEDTDFGSIIIKGKKSRPSLFKPGAEKICGMMGLTPTFPNLTEYERMILDGKEIDIILIRCNMLMNGMVIAEGVGARSVKKDNGDLNKALKMALKSAQIDATLRCAGLSEIFTQDIEDMGLGDTAQKTVDKANGLKDSMKVKDIVVEIENILADEKMPSDKIIATTGWLTKTHKLRDYQKTLAKLHDILAADMPVIEDELPY